MVKIDTKAAHLGKQAQIPKTRPEVGPIYQSSVFSFHSLKEVDEVLEKGGYIYSRYGNPNQDELARAVATLEGGEDGAVAASGMGAIAAAVLAVVEAGDHIIAADELYGGTLTLFSRDLTSLGVEVDFLDCTDSQRVRDHLRENTRLIYVESITNPTMKLPDFAELAKIAKDVGALFMVDNTFASPVLLRPLEHGADVVVHSLTKYLNGHSDITGGAVVASHDFIAQVREKIKSFGASLSPFAAWLALRGVKTLPLRMKVISENANQIAAFLDQNARVEVVHYPGIPTYPQRSLAEKYLPDGAGGMLSFELRGGLEAAERFITSLVLIDFVPSLGGLATTLSHPAKTSHRSLSKETRERLGITAGLIRLSVGIENSSDIIQDLKQALEKI